MMSSADSISQQWVCSPYLEQMVVHQSNFLRFFAFRKVLQNISSATIKPEVTQVNMHI